MKHETPNSGGRYYRDKDGKLHPLKEGENPPQPKTKEGK